jgi:hypothetical protein
VKPGGGEKAQPALLRLCLADPRPRAVTAARRHGKPSREKAPMPARKRTLPHLGRGVSFPSAARSRTLKRTVVEDLPPSSAGTPHSPSRGSNDLHQPSITKQRLPAWRAGCRAARPHWPPQGPRRDRAHGNLERPGIDAGRATWPGGGRSHRCTHRRCFRSRR